MASWQNIIFISVVVVAASSSFNAETDCKVFKPNRDGVERIDCYVGHCHVGISYKNEIMCEKDGYVARDNVDVFCLTLGDETKWVYMFDNMLMHKEDGIAVCVPKQRCPSLINQSNARSVERVQHHTKCDADGLCDCDIYNRQHIKCNPGYVVNENTHAKCLNTGNWEFTGPDSTSHHICVKACSEMVNQGDVLKVSSPNCILGLCSRASYYTANIVCQNENFVAKAGYFAKCRRNNQNQMEWQLRDDNNKLTTAVCERGCSRTIKKNKVWRAKGPYCRGNKCALGDYTTGSISCKNNRVFKYTARAECRIAGNGREWKLFWETNNNISPIKSADAACEKSCDATASDHDLVSSIANDYCNAQGRCHQSNHYYSKNDITCEPGVFLNPALVKVTCVKHNEEVKWRFIGKGGHEPSVEPCVQPTVYYNL